MSDLQSRQALDRPGQRGGSVGPPWGPQVRTWPMQVMTLKLVVGSMRPLVDMGCMELNEGRVSCGAEKV